MTPHALRELLARRPFVPFRLYVSDGRNFEVRRPELVVAGASLIIIGVVRPAVSNEFWDEPVLIANRHITGTDPIVEPDAAALSD
jgi:hypothetical protein